MRHGDAWLVGGVAGAPCLPLLRHPFALPLPSATRGDPTANIWATQRAPGTSPCRTRERVSPVPLLLRQPQITGQDPNDRRPGSVPAFALIGVQFGNHGGEAIGSQTGGGSGVIGALAMATGNLRQCAANRCRRRAAKEFPGSLRVPSDAIGFALADLNGGGSDLDGISARPGC